MVHETRNENIEALTFENDTFDIFVAKDVKIGHDAVVILDPGTGLPRRCSPVYTKGFR